MIVQSEKEDPGLKIGDDPKAHVVGRIASSRDKFPGDCFAEVADCVQSAFRPGPTTFIPWSANTRSTSSLEGGEVHVSVTAKNSSIFPAGI